MKPWEVDLCSFWQFASAVDGYNKVHGGETKPEAPSDAEFDAMIEASAEAEARKGLRRKSNGAQ